LTSIETKALLYIILVQISFRHLTAARWEEG
jgi:hypothetical protein